MASQIHLWELLVPCQYNDGKPVRTKHHQEWDKYVRKIAGGLTVYKPAKGQWVDKSENKLYAERVIPTRSACTERQIKQIAQFTIHHYRQLAVLVYEVSNKVFIITDDKKRQTQDAAHIHQHGQHSTGEVPPTG